MDLVQKKGTAQYAKEIYEEIGLAYKVDYCKGD